MKIMKIDLKSLLGRFRRRARKVEKNSGPAPEELPTQYLIVTLRDVSMKDARAYAKNLAVRYFGEVENVRYRIVKHRGGFLLVELREGGKSPLDQVIELIHDHPTKDVVIPYGGGHARVRGGSTGVSCEVSGEPYDEDDPNIVLVDKWVNKGTPVLSANPVWVGATMIYFLVALSISGFAASQTLMREGQLDYVRDLLRSDLSAPSYQWPRIIRSAPLAMAVYSGGRWKFTPLLMRKKPGEAAKNLPGPQPSAKSPREIVKDSAPDGGDRHVQR